jgi:putative ABC transport system permease protein
VRTLITAFLIGGQVALILTLVGLSDGMLGEIASRSKGTGADIIVRPSGGSILGFSGNMPQKIVNVVRKQPHVTQATGALVQSIGNFDSITGINLDEFNAISGGLKFLEGGPFTKPDDLIVDEVYARAHKLHVGSHPNELTLPWNVCGIVEPGKLSRMFAEIGALQDKYSATGKVTVIYVKVDEPSQIEPVTASLKQLLVDQQVFTVEEFVSLISVDSVPLLKQFTTVVIALGAVSGFFIVLLSMYMAVLERTREIGILKAIGASPPYIMGILLREAVLLAVAGTTFGILLSYAARFLIHAIAPTWTASIVMSWWPRAGLIALAASLVGAIYPGMKAARQDAIEALAYD